MEIQSAKSIELDSLTILLQGFSGAGKTFQATTHAPGSKILVASIEQGHFTLNGSEVDYVIIDGSSIEKLKKLKEFLEKIKDLDYDFYYIDSLTEVSQCMMEYVEQVYPDNKDAFLKFGMFKSEMIKIIKHFRDLKKNVVFTVLLKDEKDNLQRRYFAPDVSGSLKNSIAQYFDFVFTLQKNEDEERVFLTQPHDGNICKSRSNKLEMYEPASMEHIINKIQGE